MSTGIVPVKKGIENQIKSMLDRKNSVKSYFARVVYRKYQKAQLSRWITENSSEGNPWKPLDSKYKKQKRKRFAGYPGEGSKMLIATNRLYKSVIGRDSNEHRLIITNVSISIGTATPYASYVSKIRPMFKFSSRFDRDVKKGLADFIIKGVMR